MPRNWALVRVGCRAEPLQQEFQGRVVEVICCKSHVSNLTTHVHIIQSFQFPPGEHVQIMKIIQMLLGETCVKYLDQADNADPTRRTLLENVDMFCTRSRSHRSNLAKHVQIMHILHTSCGGYVPIVHIIQIPLCETCANRAENADHIDLTRRNMCEVSV